MNYCRKRCAEVLLLQSYDEVGSSGTRKEATKKTVNSLKQALILEETSR